MITRTERHIINQNHPLKDQIDHLCFLTKNLFNQANYQIRQHFFKTNEILSYNQVYHLLKKSPDYKSLPAQTAQQTLRQLDQAWRSFKEATKEYTKNPKKFTGKPKIVKYKHKIKGRSPVYFTNQQVQFKDNLPKLVNLPPIKTKVTTKINQVRLIPQATCFIIEIVYSKEMTTQETPRHYLSIDLGVNNLATCVNSIGLRPFTVNGRIPKSINQYYNKVKAKLQSKLSKDKKSSKQIRQITFKRNNRINDYLHKTSRFIVNYCIDNNIDTIIIGHNEQWKNEVNLGKKNNQNFVQIPFTKLINQIKYKSEEANIRVITNEESYTSKCSFLDNEEVCKHKKYLGKRITRGLFKSSKGVKINSDVNGSLNIAKKVVTKEGSLKPLEVIEGAALHPIRVYPDIA